MFSFFNNKPVLDKGSRDWLVETFSWAMNNFDSQYFYEHSVLVLPNNQFFPGRVDSVQGMAGLMFDKVKSYAGLKHWPTKLEDQNQCSLLQLPDLHLDANTRGVDVVANTGEPTEQYFVVPYNPQQINNPEAMIATYSHILAHYIGQMSEESPPGDAELWPQATEVVAIYLGFGLMFANSAFMFRGGCGSCGNPAAARQASLTEQQSTYALAIFAVLKSIPDTQVTKYLKKHLRSFYRKAAKEIRHDTALQNQLSPLKRLA